MSRRPDRPKKQRPLTSRRRGEGTASNPESRSAHRSRRCKPRKQNGSLAERMAEAKATLELGPVVVFPHQTTLCTSREGLDMLVTLGWATREERIETDLAALGRGEYTMRRVVVYRKKEKG